MKNKGLKKSRFPLADNDSQIRIDSAIVRLIKLVINMTETEKRELLNKLKKRHQFEYTEKRAHPRERVFIYANCLSPNPLFADFIHNISRHGLFIETEPQIPFSIGQSLALAFHPPNAENPVKRKGNIVRIDSKGLAIQFDEPIPHR